MPRTILLLIVALIAAAHAAGAAEQEAGKPSIAGSLLGFGKTLLKHIAEGPEPLPPDEGKLAVEETVLATVPTNVVITDLRISPNQRRVAYVDKRVAGATVVIDGKAGPSYDEVDGFRFSPDSRRFAYTARRGSQQFVVVDGIEGAPYNPWCEMYPIFSPDSQRVAYMAHLAKARFVVVDEVRGAPYPALMRQSLVFSPDSKRTAYSVMSDDGSERVVIDGVPGKPFKDVGQLEFSPDSKRWLHRASDQDGAHVVVDGVLGPAFYGVSVWEHCGVSFSADSKREAYSGKYKDLSQVMVVDGKLGKKHAELAVHPLTFSPNSTDTAYVAKLGELWCVVTNGVEGPPYRRLQWYPRYSPDGHRMMYAACKQSGQVAVCDGQEGAIYSYVGPPVFSPDSKRLAFAAERGFRWLVVCDGQEVATNSLGEAWRTQIVFSPDSKRLACRASQGRTAEYVVVDGRRSRTYCQVMMDNPIFSPDSAHVAYWATHSRRRWRVFVDTSYSQEYDEFLWGSKLVFDSPTSLHALAVRSREVLLLEIGIRQ